MKKIILILGIFLSLSSLAASSKEGRANKKYELTLQGSGVDYRFSPLQAAAMLFLNSNNLVGIKGGHYNNGDEQQTNFAVQYKHYTANSFYVAFELFYLNTTEDDDYFLSGLFDTEITYNTYVSTGIHFRLGNQWTWKNFTLGCDWFGVGKRVGTIYKEDHELSDTTFTFLNFILGASF